MKNKWILILPIVLIVTACGSPAAPAATLAPTAAATAVSGEVTVNITNYTFSPSPLTVKVGTTVKWINNDNVIHTVDANDKTFTSKDLNQGDSYTFTFTTAGTFQYGCAQHPLMKGTIIVTQ